jgi:hypothetical protein
MFQVSLLLQAFAHPPLAIANELAARFLEPGWRIVEGPQDLVPLGEREPEELRLDVVGSLEPLCGVGRAGLPKQTRER